MKAKELMVGDWVYRPDCYDQVKEIRHDGIIGNDDLRGLITFNELEPIPLKRIHLTKNGFKATNADDTEFVYRDGYEIKVMIEEDLADAIFLSIEFAERNIWKEIKYVHELQQAMRLMGCEQEIRL